MKRFAFAVGLVFLIFGVAILAKTQAGSVEQELMKLETEWGAAIVKHDVATIDKMLADDYIGTATDGSVYTKAQYLEYIKSYKEEVTSIVNDEWKVRIYGDAAVVNARSTSKSGQGRFSDIWIKRDGRWKCVAGHNWTIAQK